MGDHDDPPYRASGRIPKIPVRGKTTEKSKGPAETMKAVEEREKVLEMKKKEAANNKETKETKRTVKNDQRNREKTEREDADEADINAGIDKLDKRMENI